jgi:hypothetical protein
MRRVIAFEVALIVCALGTLVPMSASADSTTKRCGKTGKCYVMATRESESQTEAGSTASRDPNLGQDAGSDRRLQEARKEFDAALAEYDRQLASYNRCILSSNPASCGSMPTAPTPPQFATTTFSGPGNQPITAGQAAAIAVARLQLPTISPGIGPSPDLNPWKMAAVGYPLWLWADGATHVGPVSDSVAGLSVSLEADVSSLTFRMGDGHSVTCAGSGHPWTAAVEPGTKSPTCGYTYAKPSLPDGPYTVAAIANWAVTWTSNGQSGVINVPAVDSTELPVGELQVLVR